MDLTQADSRSAEACCMPQPPPEKVTSESYVLLTPFRNSHHINALRVQSHGYGTRSLRISFCSSSSASFPKSNLPAASHMSQMAIGEAAGSWWCKPTQVPNVIRKHERTSLPLEHCPAEHHDIDCKVCL